MQINKVYYPDFACGHFLALGAPVFEKVFLKDVRIL